MRVCGRVLLQQTALQTVAVDEIGKRKQRLVTELWCVCVCACVCVCVCVCAKTLLELSSLQPVVVDERWEECAALSSGQTEAENVIKMGCVYVCVSVQGRKPKPTST